MQMANQWSTTIPPFDLSHNTNDKHAARNSMYNTIKYQISESILTITLDRPNDLNAFTVEMSNELIDAFNRASSDDEVRAVVVTGAGKVKRRMGLIPKMCSV